MRVLRKDIQDQGGAVENFHLRVCDGAFKLTLLGRRQFIIEDHHRCSGVGPQRHQLLNLAGADIGGWMCPVETLFEAAHHAQTGRVGEPLKLAKRVRQRPGRAPPLDLDADQYRGFLHGLDVYGC